LGFAEKPLIIFKDPIPDNTAFALITRLPTEQTKPATPLAVIDTNVVLDMLLFGDARSSWLRQALDARLLAWVCTAPMLAELAIVLTRPFVAARGRLAETVMFQARAICSLVPEPQANLPRAPRCADPDDQKFIDLAWAAQAQWLFSRDHALLDLARSSRPRGLTVCTPAAAGARASAVSPGPTERTAG
jgi:putative PIN family toxin of toxin-antitoxin system